MSTTTTSELLRVRDVAGRLKVKPDAVLGWIRAGELRAFNVAVNSSGQRPRWRIPHDALDVFLAARSVATPPPVVQRRRRTRYSGPSYF